MDNDPGKMSAILIDAIAEFLKKIQPKHIRLVEVVIWENKPELVDIYTKVMKTYSNMRES